MRKIKFKKELAEFYLFKRTYVLVLLAMLVYSFFLLTNTTSYRGNIWDYFLSLTELHPLFYFITPIFLIAITSFFTAGPIQNYLMIRFSSKRTWYNHQVIFIAKFVSLFIAIFITILTLEALPSLEFKNQWSEFAVHFYSSHQQVLSVFTPSTVTMTTFALLWLFLFFIGLFYYFVSLLTGNRFITLLFMFLLIVINIAAKLSKLEKISYYLFYDRINIFQYIYVNQLEQTQFPLRIFVYWLLLILIVYIAGLLVIHKLDLTKGKDK